MKMKRKGYGKGLGEGWKNLLPNDSFRHGLASKGIKSVLPPIRKIVGLDAKAQKRLVDLEEGDVDVQAMMQIEKELGKKVEEVDERETGIYNFKTEDGEEWVIAVDEETAENLARERVREDLEDQPEIFNQDWLIGQMDDDRAEDYFRRIYDEMNQGYVGDIESESDDDYPNRLRSEMVGRNLITEEQAKDEDFEIEDFKEDFIEQMTQDKIDEGRGGYDHYAFNFGEEQAKKLVKDNNLIDIDDATDNAIKTDGWQHFVSSYDGNSTDLPNGMVMWREN